MRPIHELHIGDTFTHESRLYRVVSFEPGVAVVDHYMSYRHKGWRFNTSKNRTHMALATEVMKVEIEVVAHSKG